VAALERSAAPLHASPGWSASKSQVRCAGMAGQSRRPWTGGQRL